MAKAPAEVPLLDFGSDKLKTEYCIDLHTRDRQVAENTARVKGRIAESPDHNGHIAVVCYGPSLEDTWEELRQFTYIITCSGAHKFLIDRGIIPTWHAEVDPRPHKAELIGEPHKDVEYLVASVVHSDVLDLLEGYNVKLWHVYSHEAERKGVPYVFPRGEWALTGGTNVGLRALVLARFMGFKRVTLFGMDFSFKSDGTQHAGWHPKEFPQYLAVEADGETFYTNVAMLSYAQSFFHETRQLGFTEFNVRGNGLVQAKVREALRTDPQFLTTRSTVGMLAAQTPDVISPEYLELNRQLHQTNAAFGISGSKRAEMVKTLVQATKAESVLDYGCGKGTLARALPFPIWEYDPAIPGKDDLPRPADLVICTDVLEHIEPEYLGNVLLDLKRVVLKVCYAVINTGPAQKKLPDGRNAHLIQQPLKWWEQTLAQFFEVAKITQEGAELTAILGPQKMPPKLVKPAATQTEQGAAAPAVAPPDISHRITPTRHKGTEIRFHTPNGITEWRARSLFTKEPATIQWIESFQPGEVLYDTGANVGGYSVWAAKRRGVKVYAFEPEAENYALLVRNLMLNDVPANAYCVALSDRPQVGLLHLGQVEAGGSCHSFGEAVDPYLNPRPAQGPQQGCMGVTLDELVAAGLPKPNHIKIDVDGLEFKVIKGAEKTLGNCSVRSVLMEVNDALPEHREMLRFMGELGYTFDAAQVEAARRKDGPFKGVAEYVFTKVSPITTALVQAVERAKIGTEPFAYIYLENALPSDTYSALMAAMPETFEPIKKTRNLAGYPKRFTAEPVGDIWEQVTAALRSGPFKDALCRKFGVDCTDLTDETLLIRDKPGYAIGPHTDSPDKVISALFYLEGEEGTSLYVPKKAGFTCPGGPHHPVSKFTRVKTAAFMSNSLFAFLKTDTSFHGVERTKHQRTVLLYDVRKGAAK